MSSPLQAVVRIVRNTIGLFLVALLSKGSGLIVVIVVARYLGPEALGAYVVIMAVTMLLTTASPMGTTDIAIRAISRDHSSLLRYWKESLVTTILFACLFALLMAGGSRMIGLPDPIQAGVDIAAIGLIPGGLMWASQAPLQAIEQTRYLSMATLAGRLVGFAVLFLMLESGAGIIAAFVSHAIFLTVTTAMLATTILRRARVAGSAWRETDPAPAVIRRALPFAGQRILMDASMNINLIILPLLVSVQSVGHFDAADRIRRTIAVVMPMTMLAVMPEFSRAFGGARDEAMLLAQRTMKFLLILMLPLVLLFTVMAPAIVELLYGAGYEQSVRVLQIGAWSLLFLSADMVLKQIMIASHEERALLQRSFLGIAVQVALTIVLTIWLGITGAALSVMLAGVFVLFVDLRFVVRKVAPVDFAAVTVRPAFSAVIAGVAALLLEGQRPLIVAATATLVYLVSLVLFRAITSSELAILRQLPSSLLRKE